MIAPECGEAFFYNEHKILGHKLKPYCLYHHFVLDAIKSPLMTGGQVGVIDLYIATLICKQSYPISFKVLPSPNYWSILFNSFRFGYYQARYKTSREVSKFRSYTDDYCSRPHFWEKKDGKKSDSGVPDILTLMVALMVAFKYTEAEAWNCPLGKAIWLTATNSIISGAESRIISAEAKAFMDSMKNGKN